MERKKTTNAHLMTEKRREFFMKIMDGNPDLVGVMHILHGYKYCDNILMWLWNNKIIGKDLAEFVVKVHGKDVHKMARFIVEKINATNERVPSSISGSMSNGLEFLHKP